VVPVATAAKVVKAVRVPSALGVLTQQVEVLMPLVEQAAQAAPAVMEALAEMEAEVGVL